MPPDGWRSSARRASRRDGDGTGGIGAGIVLLVVGGILGFAVDADVVSGVNLNIVGFVCIAAGALALVLGVVQTFTAQKRTDRVEYVDERRPRDYPPGR